MFDVNRLNTLVRESKPEIVLHQLTAFGATDADPMAATIRIRTEGTRNLVAAAIEAGARRFLTQSISFICTPIANRLTQEHTPLYLDAPPGVRPLAHAVSDMEQRTLDGGGMEGVVLRYGWFYGPGTNYDPADAIPRAIKRGRMPLAGGGNGTYSFIDVHDAATATMAALTRASSGIYNIVDDEPAKQRDWVPFVAELLGGPTPSTMEEGLAREKLGDMMVYVFNEQSGASNRRAKAELRWQPSTPSWRTGFKRLYGQAEPA